MNISTKAGHEVNRSNPCPGCGGTDWCFQISDTAYVCDRNPEPVEGYECRGTAKDGRPIFAKIGSKSTPKPLSERVLPIEWQPKTDSPQWEPTGSQDNEYSEQSIEYHYPDPVTGQPLGKIIRKQWSDRRAVYGRGTKKTTKEIRPWHWAKPTPGMIEDGAQGWWSDRGKGDQSWPLYRQGEVDSDSILFVVAGEQAVETIRIIGGVAVCNQGGENTATGRKQIVKFLQSVKPKLVVFLPDNDHTGRDWAAALKAELDKKYIKSVVLDLSEIWNKLPVKGDIFDLLTYSGLSVEDIQDAIETEIERLLEPLDIEEQLRSQLPKNHYTTDLMKGLVFHDVTPSGDLAPFTIGNHLEAIGYCQSPTGDGAALVLRFQTVQGYLTTYLMPRSLLAGDGNEILSELLARSYQFVRSQKQLLLDYLHGLGDDIQNEYLLMPATGWAEIQDKKSFVLPHRTIGDQRLRFQSFDPPPNHPYSPRGTLEDWQSSIARYAKGNSRLVFSLSASFAGTLLEPLDLQGGGFNLFGQTSRGKTTAIEVAASVSGNPEKILRSWRATDNGLEAIAAEHNHLTLFLDELKEAHPKVVDQASYLLANGVGKQRARRNGDRAAVKTWRELFLSTGEMPFTQYLRSQGMTAKGGQEIRLIDIEAIAGEHGVFENLHGFADGASLSNHLKQATRRCHGTALPAFLEALPEIENIATLRESFNGIRKALPPSGAIDAAVGRAIERFAAVALAGEIAIKADVLPIPEGEPTQAAQTLLLTWLNLRGGVGSHDLAEALNNIEAILRGEYHTGLVVVDGLDKIGDPPRGQLLGYLKDGEILVLPSVFRDRFCQGCDRKILIQELITRGWLVPGTDKIQSQVKIAGKNQRFYRFIEFWGL